MLNGLMQKLGKLRTWQLIFLFVILAEFLSAIMNAVLSRIFWGKISLDLIFIGTIDALVVSFIVSTVGIYLIGKNTALTNINERLREGVKARERAEIALRESEERLRSVVENTPVVLFALDQKGIFTLSEGKGLKALGLKRGEVVGQSVFEVYRDAPSVLEGVKRALTGEAFTTETEVDGLVFEVRYHPVRDGLHELLGTIGVAMDITERKQAEAKLRESERKYRKIYENSLDVFYQTDLNGDIVEISPLIEKYSGYKRDELIGKPIINCYFYPEDRAKLLDVLQKKGEVIDFEARLKTKDERLAYNSVNAYLLFDESGKLIGMEGSLRDITERKLTGEALRTSESRYRAIVENQAEFVVRYLPGGIITFVNDTLCRYANIPREDLLGRSYYRFMHEEDREAFVAKIEALDLTNQSMVADARVVLPDGRVTWHQWTHHAIFNDEGGLVEYQCTGRDISDIKSAQEALKRSETLLQAIIDTEPECVKLIDAGGNLIMMNRAGLAMIEADSLDQVRGQCVCPLVADEYLEAFEGLIKRVFAGESGTLAFKMRGLKGRSLWLETHAVPFRNEKKEIVAMLGVTRDITEKKKLEDDLLRAQKLESLGILAGGLAHDFNNLLVGIMGNISFAKMYVEETSKAHERLEEAEKASERARELTQQLLTFSSGGEPVREVASVEKVVREMSSFALRGSNVACKVFVADNIWSAYMDSGQISQVINNIIINAKQAMPEGGFLDISCENVIVDRGTSLTLREGKYIKISLSDSGIGIPREYLAKIFDPYFTTKEEGRGLGLAACYSIMKKHGGHLEVTSEPGKGTTFTLYLPAREEKPVEHEFKKIMLRPRQGKILVMDDEEMVRDIAGEMLKKLGYKVCFAGDGRDAIEKFEEARAGGEPFDAVIMDLTVPGGMGGREAVRELLRIDPHVKAIVSSGYANDPITANCREYGFIDVLAKPYKMNDLGRVVEKVLSSR